MESDLSKGSGAVMPVWARSVVGGGVTAGIIHIASGFQQQIADSGIVIPAIIVSAIVALCSLVADLDRRTPRGILALGSGLIFGGGVMLVYLLMSAGSRGYGYSGLGGLTGGWSSVLCLLAIGGIGVIRSGRDQAQRLAGGLAMMLLTVGSLGVAYWVVVAVVLESYARSPYGGSSGLQLFADGTAAMTGTFFTFSLIIVQAGVLGKRPQADD